LNLDSFHYFLRIEKEKRKRKGGKRTKPRSAGACRRRDVSGDCMEEKREEGEIGEKGGGGGGRGGKAFVSVLIGRTSRFLVVGEGKKGGGEKGGKAVRIHGALGRSSG